MRHLAETGVEDPHWFLICKGARTYRFLPTFFRRYVPGPREDPELAERLRREASAPRIFAWMRTSLLTELMI